MTCMDIIKQLDSADRAECWQIFTKLSRVFMIKNSQEPAEILELRMSAQRMNDIFVENGFDSYFNTELDESRFIDSIVAEMLEIKNGNKIKD